MKKIKVAELFAGVGGFRLGLEGKNPDKSEYSVIWSNQWEPSTKIQHASDIYVSKFGEQGHSNEDIELVVKNNFQQIKNHDLLVGGFPCQDYSVARILKDSKGLIGKKGVLWWSIYNILKKKGKDSASYLLLENVDRLLKSPANQRGRDFAIMLASLSDLGYAVEWRVINAAEYGFPQRRKRIFILGYKKGTKAYNKLKNSISTTNWLDDSGVITKAFPVERINLDNVKRFKIDGDTVYITKNFLENNSFENSGIMINRKIVTAKTEAMYKGKKTLLRDVLVDEKDVSKDFFVEKQQLKRWAYLKDSKKEKRISKSGFEYNYSEGAMSFPDSLDKPSRTIVTGEGGSSPSRFKHVVRVKSGKLRRLVPIELERLCMFPDEYTKDVSDTKRAFLMGNALVVGVVNRLGESLKNYI